VTRSWRSSVRAGGPRQPRRAPPGLFEADDYVRLELARALDRNVRVVPVLVGGAAMPAATELPGELKGLVRRQAVVLHDETWHQDVDGLVGSLRGEPALPARRRPRWLVPGVAVAVALVALGTAAWWWGPGGGGGGSGAGGQGEPPACARPAGEGWSRIALNGNPTAVETVPEGSLLFKVREAHWRARGGMWQVILTTSMENRTPGPVYHGDWRYQYLVVGQRPFEATCFSSKPAPVDPRLVDDALIGFEVTCKPAGYIELALEDDKSRIKVTKDLNPGPC
jgi:hypothetical protein